MKKLFLILIVLLIKIDVRATSTIVMDLDSERILYQNNAYESRLIASTTKIMTFVVAYEYGNHLLDEKLVAGEEVLKMYGTSIYLNYQEEMTLRNLLYGLMLRSGNDAAVVIASNIAGSEDAFVKLMNDKAKEIGMHNTIFKNSHGLDEETKNYSTAYDMALLSCYAYKIPLYREISGTKYYNTKTDNKAYAWTNRNKLLFLYDSLTGGKTGYTPSAGKTFASTATKNSLNLTIVTLDDPNLYEHHEELYEKYFSQYKNYTIVRKNYFNINPQYTKKKVYIMGDIKYPLREEEYKNVSYNVYIDEDKDTNQVGYVEVLLNDEKVLQEPIFLKKTYQSKSKSFFQKLLDFFK